MDTSKLPNKTEEFSIASDELPAKFKELVREGNVRRISVQAEDGRTLFEIPLTAGVAGVAATLIFAPALAAIGTVAALVTHVRVTVERVDDTQGPKTG